MNIKILKQKESPLLSRKRISVEATFKGATPSKSTLKKELATKLKAKEDLIEIRHVYGKFGEERAKVIAHVYDNEKVMKALIHKKKEKEVKKKETVPVAETKPAEPAKKEEKKPEEKKEDKKKEEKK